MSSTPHNRSGQRAIDRIAESLRAAGRTVKVTRSGGNVHLQASCPIHGADRNPSLSVDQHAGENRAHMYCHTCFDSATERDLAEAIGLHYDEMWDDAGGECVWCHKRTIPLPETGELIHPRCADQRAGRPRQTGGAVAQLPAPKPHPVKPGMLPARLTKDWPQQRRVGRSSDVAFYEHEDLDGTVLGRSVRTEAQYELVDEDGSTRLETQKGLRLEHPDHTTASGWASKLPDAAQIPLWRPREVAAAIAAGREVWNAEGHKNAQRLIDAGVVATTNINGAGSFNEHHAEQLRGARVVQACDRDLAGWRRAMKCARLLDGVAEAIRFVLPVPTEPKADAFDHLDQGHSIEEFIPVTLAEIETFALLGEAEQLLSTKYLGSAIPRELRARQHRAEAATDPAATAIEAKAADRWAIEAGRKLVKLHELQVQLVEHPARTSEQLATMDGLVMRAGDIVVDAYTACQLALPDEINKILAAAAADDPVEDNTADLSSRILPAPANPVHLIAMSGRADWAYSLGEEGTSRGVYYRASAHQAWQWIGPLPHVEARLIRRDAADDKTGLDYLVGVTPDAPTITVTPRMLSDGSWANQLGVPLSADPQVVRAVATAIIYHAHEDVPEHESAARVSADGRIQMPPKLPSGWLETSPAGPDRALSAWRGIAAEATPVMAHTIAAAAFAPFLRDIGTQPHVISLTSGKGAGKTLTLQLAAAIWGNPTGDQTDLFDNWNTTAKGLPLILGSLRMLPAFRDEAGMAGLSAQEWGVLLYTLTQGASRTRGTRDGGGTRTASWRGILFATGNGEILAGAEGGAFDGLDRRVIDFAYPTFTASREHAKRLYNEGQGLLTDCYGHLGQRILDQFTIGRVRELLTAASTRLSIPEGRTAKEVRDLMRTHVAGAMMLDELLGTGDLLTGKTIAHAEAYLSNLPDVTDGDRLLEVLLESLASTPNSWPTRDQYLALNRPWGDDQSAPLPKGGINASRVLGIKADDNDEIWAFTEKLRELAGGLNVRVGLSELEQRRIFWRQPQKRTSQEYRSQKPLGTKPSGRPLIKSVYVFRLDQLPDDSDPAAGGDGFDSDPDGGGQETLTDLPAASDITGGSNPITGGITGGITGDNMALTRSITGITGNPPDNSRHASAREPDHGQVDTNELASTGTRAAEFTSATTADWTMEQLEDALADCWDDAPAVAALEHLIDARDRAHSTSPTVPAEIPAASDTAGIVPAAPLRQPGDPRYVAPAAVLDGDTVHLPGGRTHTWSARHLGDLAVLASEHTGLRLGWGGGDALPDQGQLWLTGDAIARLGLPERMDLPEKAYFGDEFAKAITDLYEPLNHHPSLTAALAEGWELQQDRLDAWTRLRHPDLLPGGALIVFAPWWRIKGVGLFAGDPDPAALAERLHEFAKVTGVSYRVSSQATGLALIDHTRPPRRTADEPTGRAYRLVRNEEPQLPPFLLDRRDDRFTSIETDYTWWRLWQPATGSARAALLAGETELPYVHGYDRGASHLGGWHVELGVEGLRHHVGTDARWNGKTSQAGLWLISLWDWDEWGLPDPATALNARVEGDRVWVTTPTLSQLKLHGVTPTIHEAWIWAKSSRYLDLAAKVIADARTHPDPLMVTTIKDLYTRTNGKLAERRPWRTVQHLHRPDWYFTVVAQSRFAIDLQLTKIQREHGAMPLAVDHDAVFYASTEPNPMKAWPGDPSKLGTGVGQWKPIGSADLGTWGPKHLTEATAFVAGQPLPRGWLYKNAANDLTPPGAWRAEIERRG